MQTARNVFQSTRPSRGETRQDSRERNGQRIFQSTRPSRGETHHKRYGLCYLMGFQSTRPSRGETSARCAACWGWYISIHSPLAGRDLQAKRCYQGSLNFNPLAPRGARPASALDRATSGIFQSTRPSRGETMLLNTGIASTKFQSTRPSRGETGLDYRFLAPIKISIHSPLAGRDYVYRGMPRSSYNFNPLAPRGARPVACGIPVSAGDISIHSPLAGRDGDRAGRWPDLRYFNPLAPRGARQAEGGGQGMNEYISIHSPLAGRDLTRRRGMCTGRSFQSTRPSRGETAA